MSSMPDNRVSAREHKTSRRKLRATGDESYDVVNSGAEDWVSDDTRTTEEALGYLCPRCGHGSLYPVRCGGPRVREALAETVEALDDAIKAVVNDARGWTQADYDEWDAVRTRARAALPSGRQHSREGG